MTVAAGHTHTATIDLNAQRRVDAAGAGAAVAQQDCVVVWEFATASYDIAVSVQYGGSEVRPHARWPSHRGAVSDAFAVPPRPAGSGDGAEAVAEPGSARRHDFVTLKFDNTYSRLRPKQLRYRVAVVSRSEAIAATGRAEEDARRAGFTVTKQALSPLSHVHMLLREDSASSCTSETNLSETSSFESSRRDSLASLDAARPSSYEAQGAAYDAPPTLSLPNGLHRVSECSSHRSGSSGSPRMSSQSSSEVSTFSP